MFCTICEKSSSGDSCYWCGSTNPDHEEHIPVLSSVQVSEDTAQKLLDDHTVVIDCEPVHLDIDLGKTKGLRVRAQTGIRDCQIELQNDDGTWSRIPGVQRLVLILDAQRMLPQLRITKVVL